MGLKETIKRIPGIMNVRNLQLAFSAPVGTILRSRKEIREYYNTYQGKRCFIIGNGPSLTPTDLDLIKDEISFAANTIYKIFPQTEWRPTFFCVQDEKVLRNIANDSALAEVNRCKAAFIRLYSSRIVKETRMELDHIIYVPIWSRLTSEYAAPFSDRADRFVYDGSMVTYLSLQLAVYMGFRDIYLIGMDHSFPYRRTRNGDVEVNDLSIKTHFWESAANNHQVDLHANYHELAENSYREAERFSRESGRFRIYNATRGGKLEVFERVVLENVLRSE